MDISNIVAKPKVVEIRKPNSDELLGLRVTLLPDTHGKVRKVHRKNQDRMLGKGKITSAQLEAGNFDLLVAAVDSWEWYGEEITFHGEKPECTEDKVRQVLREADFIRNQLRAEFDDSESFFEA